MTFKAVSELLPGLSKPELQKVKDRCTVLIGGVVSPITIKSKRVVVGPTTIKSKYIELVRASPDDWYAHAVGRYAVKRGWCPKKMVSVHLSQQGLALLPEYHARSRETRAHVEGMLRSVKSDKLEHVGDLCVKALVLMIEDANKQKAEHDEQLIHIDTFKLLSWVAQVPRALDHQFPGYMSRGMLGLVLRARGGLNV